MSFPINVPSQYTVWSIIRKTASLHRLNIVKSIEIIPSSRVHYKSFDPSPLGVIDWFRK